MNKKNQPKAISAGRNFSVIKRQDSRNINIMGNPVSRHRLLIRSHNLL